MQHEPSDRVALTAASAVFAAAVFYLTSRLLSAALRRNRRASSVRTERFYGNIALFEHFSGLIEIVRPFVALVMSRMSTKNLRDMEAQISNAGLSASVTLQDFVALRLAVGLTGFLAAGVCVYGRGGLNLSGALIPPTVGLLAWVWPTVWLTRKARDYQRCVLRGLSDTLDVLAMSMSAGIDLRSGLERVFEVGAEPELSVELRRTLEEIDKGGKPIHAALDALGARVGLPEMAAFVSAVQMAVRYGGSNLAQILTDQAQALRNERVLRAENYANRIPSRILLPIVLCMLPAIFVTMLGPVALDAYLMHFKP